jgi:hypothetical protein
LWARCAQAAPKVCRGRSTMSGSATSPSGDMSGQARVAACVGRRPGCGGGVGSCGRMCWKTSWLRWGGRTCGRMCWKTSWLRWGGGSCGRMCWKTSWLRWGGRTCGRMCWKTSRLRWGGGTCGRTCRKTCPYVGRARLSSAVEGLGEELCLLGDMLLPRTGRR